MNRNIINDWLQTHRLPLQELTIRYNIPLEEVVEIAGFYLLINCTIDIVHLYSQLDILNITKREHLMMNPLFQ